MNEEENVIDEEDDNLYQWVNHEIRTFYNIKLIIDCSSYEDKQSLQQ